MATFYSSYQKARNDAQAGVSTANPNDNDTQSGRYSGVYPVPISASMAVNDFIDLGPAAVGLSVIPEVSRVRTSNTASTLSAKLQLVDAAGTATDLSAALAVGQANVPFVAAAATALPVATAGSRWRLLITAVTTVVATTILSVELEQRRTTGAN